MKFSTIVYFIGFCLESAILVDSNNTLAEDNETNLQPKFSNTEENNAIVSTLPEKKKQLEKDDDSVKSLKNEVDKPRKKRRRKTKNKVLKIDILDPLVPELSSVSNLSEFKTKRTKKLRKRRRRKKKLLLQNDVLQIPTTNISDKTINPDKILVTEAHQTAFKVNVNSGTTSKTSTKDKSKKKQNRCAKNNGGCSQGCKPKGKKRCFCLRGYTLAKNRKKCIDVDECKFRNGGCKHSCQNIPGAFYCDCAPGYRIADDARSCEDINECFLRNGHGPCQGFCTNTRGSYVCDCSNLNGTRLSQDGHSCLDVDECAEGTSGCSHTCINAHGRVYCSCPEGMELKPDWKTCADVDECQDETVCQNGCVNSIGSYYCEDTSNFQSDQFFNGSKITVCAPLNPPKHGFISCSRNHATPYDTFTKKGRRRITNSPGTRCRLVCPTGFRLKGNGRFVCGLNGKWKGNKKGVCLEATNPGLKCPSNQTLVVNEGSTATVNFLAPRTGVSWKYLKAYPKWAKNLRGELGLGHHLISFSVTDPATELSATCTFAITIKT